MKKSEHEKKIKHIDLGMRSYRETWEFQKNLRQNKFSRDKTDYLITVEHTPVYTLGKTGNKDHLLLNRDEILHLGIEFFETDRGGDITFHGPGQLVLYPIIDLNNYYRDTHRFLRDLEETVIITLAHFGISASREEGLTGVWFESKKICAIGVNVSRWITMHGLALNVNTDLKYFSKIIPCGIFHKDITSMKEILGTEQDIEEVKDALIISFADVFGVKTY